MSGNGSRRLIASRRLSLQSTIKKFSNCNACNKDNVQPDLLLLIGQLSIICVYFPNKDAWQTYNHLLELKASGDLDKELLLRADVSNLTWGSDRTQLKMAVLLTGTELNTISIINITFSARSSSPKAYGVKVLVIT